MDMKSFDDLIYMGCITKEVVIGSHKFVLQTFNDGNRAAISANIPKDLPEDKYSELLQKMIISASIISIDGMIVTEKEKIELLSKAQSPLLLMLLEVYDSMLQEQAKVFEVVKKNILAKAV